MRVLRLDIEKGVMTVTILIDPQEFALALQAAYKENKERFHLPGYEGKTIPRQKLEEVYGPTVLYDEALDLAIPQYYEKFLAKNEITQAGQPDLTGVTWQDDGGVEFTVQAPVYPKIRLGQYKGLAIKEALGQMEVEDIPEQMLDQKLDALVAQEKMRINQDAIYNVLADAVKILDKAYRAIGLNRPAAQVHSEGMDIMLQTMSGDQKEPSKEHFCSLVSDTVKRYRELPGDFNEQLDKIISERMREKEKMPPEKRAEEVFAAYLGSLELSEEGWRAQQMAQAAEQVKEDLLLDEVGKLEQITVTDGELAAAYEDIARQCGLDVGQVVAATPAESVRWQVRRDKARQFILDNAQISGEERGG